MRNDDEFARKNSKSRGQNLWVSQLISMKIKMLWKRLLSSLNLYNLPQLHTGFTHMVHSQDNSFENQFKSEFGNKEFMIWATVISWTCFCWVYRASPSLPAKNIINLILVMFLCRVFSCVVGRVAMISAFSWQNCISLCPTLFCTPRPNLPVTPGISWLPTFAFQSPVWKGHLFWGVNSRRSCRSS